MILLLLLLLLYSRIGQRITAVRLSPDGNLIASGDSGRDIKVWEIGKNEPLVTRRWMAHQSSVSTLSWSPDGRRLVSGALDGNMVVWNLDSTREIHERPQIHPGGVYCVEWHENNVVYSCGDDACAREIQLVM